VVGLDFSVDLLVVVLEADAVVDEGKYFAEQSYLLTVAIQHNFIVAYLRNQRLRNVLYL